MKSKTWIGAIPDIFGYGMIVTAESRAECMAALKKHFAQWKAQRGYLAEFEQFKSFARAFEYFGGYVRQVERGKVYCDGFAE